MKKPKKILAVIFITICVAHSRIVNANPSDSPYNNSIVHLHKLYAVIEKFALQKGRYPNDGRELMSYTLTNPNFLGYENTDLLFEDLKNDDCPVDLSDKENKIKYKICTGVGFERPDGSKFRSIKPRGTNDIIGRLDFYVKRKVGADKNGFLYLYKGDYLALSDDGDVYIIPPDAVGLYRMAGDEYTTYLPMQAGIPFQSLSYEEASKYFFHEARVFYKDIKDNKITIDNGGPEALVLFSRRVAYPVLFGIDRSRLWATFDSAQSEFTLTDIQIGATKLGLRTQAKKQTLPQLQKTGTPALLFLQDDGRIVTLSAIDDDRAVIIDRGMTQNVERSVLEKRYSGEALIPTKALTQNAAIVADDAVREVKLSSLDAEVPQQFVLRNTGATPITLQLEYPLLGVTESKLSKDVLAPGETATLDLKVKWRSILKAPYQNVLVSIQTNDPIVPRLQLAILLTPPKAAGN